MPHVSQFAKSWDEFFGKESHSSHKYRSDYLNSTDTNYYVDLCGFVRLRLNGAILIQSQKSNLKFLIEDCCFYECLNQNGVGGSLIYSNKGKCYQIRIHSVRSQGLGSHYCYICTSRDLSLLYDSSISQSANGTGIGTGNVDFYNSKFDIKNINVSHAYTYGESIFWLKEITTGSNISLSTFVGNNISYFENTLNWFEGDVWYSELRISFCDYKDNLGVTDLMTFYEIIGFVSRCNFKNDKNIQYLFWQQSEGRVVVDNCYLVNYNKKGTVRTETNANSELNLDLSHYTVLNCKKYQQEEIITYIKAPKRFLSFLEYDKMIRRSKIVNKLKNML